MHAWVALHPTTAAGERAVTGGAALGRERELGLLTGAWARVTDERRAQFVTVFGPSGIGKTRLSLELSQFVAAQGGRVIRGRSTPYGASTPYSAFAQQVKQIARIFDSDEAEPAYAKLSAAVAELAGPAAAEEHVPHLATLLGLGNEDGASTARRCSSPPGCSSSRSRCKGRRCCSTRTSTGPTTACSTCSRRSPRRVHDVPVLFVALARPELLDEQAGLVRRRSVLHGAPARPAQPGGEPPSSPGSCSRSALASARQRSPRRRRATRSSSRSCRRRSPSARRPRPAGCRPACRRSSRPARRAAARRAAGPRRRSVVGRVFWRGALSRDRHPRRPLRAPRLARGSRPHPPRGGLTDLAATSSSGSSTG